MSEVAPSGCRSTPESSLTTGKAAAHALRAAASILCVLAIRVSVAQAAECTIARFPDVPVTVSGLRPMVHAQLNGKDALFLADSGAFFSDVSPSAVQEYHLSVQTSAISLELEGVAGRRQNAQVVRAKTFSLVGIPKTWQGVDFTVAGRIFGDGTAIGLLGQNFFRIADVEYDLANGVIRLVRPQGNCKNTSLAYWAADAQKHYSVIDIESATAALPHTRSVAYLNGAKIHVWFDTGSSQSILTLAAAKRAGVMPTSEGVISGGGISGGGGKPLNTWITRFDSFKIGDEEIQHARLRFGEMDLLGADMLIGADFFLSHRIYVASSQNRLYFTYNGGPVFDLSASRTQAPSPAEAAGAAPAVEALPPAAKPRETLDTPTDAAGYARRASASASRNDYDSAISDLTRACELAPTEAAYFYQRGIAYWHGKQQEAALADFDQAIRLKPGDAEALTARASLRNSRRAPAAAVIADLEAADAALSKDDDLHLGIGSVYEAAGHPQAAVIQASKWIGSHPQSDTRMPVALNSRCWARGLAGEELEQALLDCNAALKMRPNTSQYLDSRGLIYLRLNNYDNAIADYDAALRLRPQVAWSLYGRGLAKLHKGMSAEGHADIAAATAVEPGIAKRAAMFGIAP